MIEELQQRIDILITEDYYLFSYDEKDWFDNILQIHKQHLSELIELKEILEHAQQDQITGWSEEFLAGRKATLEWVISLIK